MSVISRIIKYFSFNSYNNLTCTNSSEIESIFSKCNFKSVITFLTIIEGWGVQK